MQRRLLSLCCLGSLLVVSACGPPAPVADHAADAVDGKGEALNRANDPANLFDALGEAEYRRFPATFSGGHHDGREIRTEIWPMDEGGLAAPLDETLSPLASYELLFRHRGVQQEQLLVRARCGGQAIEDDRCRTWSHAEWESYIA